MATISPLKRIDHQIENCEEGRENENQKICKCSKKELARVGRNFYVYLTTSMTLIYFSNEILDEKFNEDTTFSFIKFSCCYFLAGIITILFEKSFNIK